MFDGVGDLFARARRDPELSRAAAPLGGSTGYRSWLWLTCCRCSRCCCCRANCRWRSSRTSTSATSGRRPGCSRCTCLLINVFVLPVAIGGPAAASRPARSMPDAFVLALPLADDRADLALLVFVGGLAAATGMVVVETIALATMVSNSLLLPVLLRREDALAEHRDLGRSILRIRRVTIVGLLLLGYAYFRMAGESLELVSIGLISFAAVAQFAPAILGGHVLAWRDPQRRRLGTARGVRRVGLHAPAAVTGTGGPAAGVVRRERPLRYRDACSLFAFRCHRARRGDPLDDVEHARQRRAVRRAVADRSPGPRRARHRIVVRRRDGQAGPQHRGSAVARVGDRGSARGAARPLSRLRRRPLGAAGARGTHRCRRVGGRGGSGGPRGARRGVAGGRGGVGVGAVRRRVRGRRGTARGGRGVADPRRDLAGAGVQPCARDQVAAVAGSHHRVAGGQPAPAGTRPAQGRIRLHRLARTTHAAHVHPGVLRDPLRQPRSRRRRTAGSTCRSSSPRPNGSAG